MFGSCSGHVIYNNPYGYSKYRKKKKKKKLLTETLTCNITLRISALTLGANICEVLWKHQSTIPPLLNMVNKSSIVALFFTNKKGFSFNTGRTNLLMVGEFDFCTRQILRKLWNKIYQTINYTCTAKLPPRWYGIPISCEIRKVYCLTVSACCHRWRHNHPAFSGQLRLNRLISS